MISTLVQQSCVKINSATVQPEVPTQQLVLHPWLSKAYYSNLRISQAFIRIHWKFLQLKIIATVGV